MGWSFTNVKETIFQTTRDICELLSAFHCGKGVTATESVMGLSVTRHLLLLLNHLLAEMLTADFKVIKQKKRIAVYLFQKQLILKLNETNHYRYLLI